MRLANPLSFTISADLTADQRKMKIFTLNLSMSFGFFLAFASLDLRHLKPSETSTKPFSKIDEIEQFLCSSLVTHLKLKHFFFNFP